MVGDELGHPSRLQYSHDLGQRSLHICVFQGVLAAHRREALVLERQALGGHTGVKGDTREQSGPLCHVPRGIDASEIYTMDLQSVAQALGSFAGYEWDSAVARCYIEHARPV